MRKISFEEVSDSTKLALARLYEISGSHFTKCGKTESYIRTIMQAGWSLEHIFETLKYQWRYAQERGYEGTFSPQYLWGDLQKFEQDCNAAHTEARAAIRENKQVEIERERTRREQQQRLELEVKVESFLANNKPSDTQVELINLLLPYGTRRPKERNYITDLKSAKYAVIDVFLMNSHHDLTIDEWIAGDFPQSVLDALARDKQVYPSMWGEAQ